MAIVGIDLGTTNSAVCVWKDGAPQLVPNRLGDYLTPSVVSLDGDRIVVGKGARDRLITHSTRTIGAFKRLMGTEHRIKLDDGHVYTAPELSAMVLRSLKEDAEEFLGETVDSAVISVPAYFSENQRQSTRLAGELAGLKVNRLINEPTAAALAYELHSRPEGTFMILDLGGGTFDVSIIEYFDGIMEVHASAGDNFLGGEDFVEALKRAFFSAHEIDPDRLSNDDLQKLHARMETAKRNVKRGVPFETSLVLAGKEYAWSLDEATFERLCTALLLRIENPIRQALYDANRSTDQIDDVILVGGATRMPIFRSVIARLFRRLPKFDHDPDIAIAMGAAIQAALAAQDHSLQDIVITDVCPYSLGTGVVGANSASGRNYFAPIIERNTTVPISRVERFWTVSDNQTTLCVEVLQGESRFADENVCLSMINVTIPPDKAGAQSISVRFSYDLSGLLEVDVTVDSTQQKFSKTVESRPGAMSEAELAASRQRLAALKFHPRDTEENRAFLARCDRLYQMLLGNDRDHIARVIDRFEAALERQVPAEIDRVRCELAGVLAGLDPDRLE